MIGRLPGLGLALAMACTSGQSSAPETRGDPEPSSATAPVVDEAATRVLLQRYECNRCHEGTILGAAAPDKQCVGCHQRILDGTQDAAPELLAKWQSRLQSLNAAPSLAAVGRKLRREWLEAMLLSPGDVRPALPATMPRFDLDAETARRMALALIPSEAPASTFDSADISRGRELFDMHGCRSCHQFGDDAVSAPSSYWSQGKPQTPTARARFLAPDLAQTRLRFQSGRLVEWLRNPQAIDRGTLMPGFGLSEADARSLAAYLWLSPLPTRALPALPERLPLLEREVTWDDVSARVFKKVCWHCHSAPDYARGDGGPGNTGGFGFPARGLDLSSYEGISSGSLGVDGRRRSVFAKDEAGVPLLVRHLWARHREASGQARAGDVRGMPLGLPPMPAADIQLVESWIEQGRPRGEE